MNEAVVALRAGQAVILPTDTVYGLCALPGHADFCAAMAGVNALTKILATEWAEQGIRVVGIGAGLSASTWLRPPRV